MSTIRQDETLHDLIKRKAPLSEVELLTGANPDCVKVTDKWGYTPIHRAMENDTPPEQLALLLNLWLVVTKSTPRGHNNASVRSDARRHWQGGWCSVPFLSLFRGKLSFC